jgi:hypothetical protein
MVRDNLIPILEKNSLASLVSNSPVSTIILPTHQYLQITSSRRNLHIGDVSLVINAQPSTWLLRSSLASTRYFVCHHPIGIIAMSTIHCTALPVDKSNDVHLDVRHSKTSDIPYMFLRIDSWPPIFLFNTTRYWPVCCDSLMHICRELDESIAII